MDNLVSKMDVFAYRQIQFEHLTGGRHAKSTRLDQPAGKQRRRRASGED
jgi:hypothetical protein